jgi:hypothetical protein
MSGFDSRLEVPGPTHLSSFARFNVQEEFAPGGQQSSDASNIIPVSSAISAGFQVLLQAGPIPRGEVATHDGAKFFSIFAARVREMRHTC